jgi:hypothetical protein
MIYKSVKIKVSRPKKNYLFVKSYYLRPFTYVKSYYLLPTTYYLLLTTL